MKKIYMILVALVMLLAGCDVSPAKQPVSNSGVAMTTATVKTNESGHTVEQENIKARLELVRRAQLVHRVSLELVRKVRPVHRVSPELVHRAQRVHRVYKVSQVPVRKVQQALKARKVFKVSLVRERKVYKERLASKV